MLGHIAEMVTDKISSSELTLETYISTQNMVPNRGGVQHASKMPTTAKVNAFLPGDVLFSNIRTYFKKVWFANRHGGASADIIIFRPLDKRKIDSRYLYYVLSSDAFIASTVTASKGTKMPRGDKFAMGRYKVRLPTILIQQKIAAILSAYDDFIENNLRRIKILEEMAQTLYREWFVKFRFPGHEEVRMVDSPLGKIPEGWKVSTLGQHLVSLESGKRPQGGVGGLDNGIPSVGAENVVGIGFHNYQNEKFVSSAFFQNMKKGVVQSGDVALYKDGAYIGRSTYFLNDFPHKEFCVNEHVFLLRSKGGQLTQNALYLWLNESSTISAIRATNANAAQPGVNQKGVKGLELITPYEEIASRFDEIVEPYLAQIVNLAKRNNVLRQTRDLLLPKLISGELDVSELEINIGETA